MLIRNAWETGRLGRLVPMDHQGMRSMGGEFCVAERLNHSSSHRSRASTTWRIFCSAQNLARSSGKGFGHRSSAPRASQLTGLLSSSSSVRLHTSPAILPPDSLPTDSVDSAAALRIRRGPPL